MSTVLGLLLVVAACGLRSSEPTELAGFQRSPVPEVGDVTLPVAFDAGDYVFTAPDDGVLVVYFGFTHCPDICPTTLADVRLALNALGDDADRVEVVMATIDPERDTDEVLTGYVQSFVDDAVALRSPDEDVLRAATTAFGADYTVGPPPEGSTEPEVAHTTSLYAVDADGRLVVTWAFGTPADDIAADLRILLDRA